MNSSTIFGAITATLLVATTASALPLGTNITISDRNSSGTGWYSNREDQEVEPGTQTGQRWDLEGMFLNGTTLTLVGGFDFKNGVNYNHQNYSSGDVFIDIDGDARYGSSDNGGSGTGGTVRNRFGYDYVFDLDFTTMTFDILALGRYTYTSRGSDVAASNPWRYVSGGSAVSGYQDIAFQYYSGLSDSDVGGLLGGTHYAISLDVSFFTGKEATYHNTMSCGNDSLMGRGRTSVPDSTATLSLFGAALASLVGVRRWLMKA